MTYKLDHWFPVPILQYDVSDDTRELVRTKVNAWLESHPEYAHMTDQEVVKTSYAPDANFLGDADIRELATDIMTAANLYMLRQGVSGFPTVDLSSWVNVFEPNDVESVHEHYGAFLSGCYYVDTPTDCGDIAFYDTPARRMWATEYSLHAGVDLAPLAASVTYTPKAGRILVFPPWLPHEVHRNKSSNNRVSIAFNLLITK